uniref:Putative secreted protein n=1 Tax=Ixodes ricinus TaxID=34613 RepID=A0A6B0UP25_IXORI
MELSDTSTTCAVFVVASVVIAARTLVLTSGNRLVNRSPVVVVSCSPLSEIVTASRGVTVVNAASETTSVTAAVDTDSVVWSGEEVNGWVSCLGLRLAECPAVVKRSRAPAVVVSPTGGSGTASA